MTKQTELDLLELAEAVAAGEIRPTDAEARMPDAVEEIRLLTSAVDAVRVHARATHAVSAAMPAAGESGAVQAGMPVGAGRVRRRPTADRRSERGGRRTLLLVAATLLLGTTALAIAFGGGLPVPPRPSLPAVVDASATHAPATPTAPPPASSAPASVDPNATDSATPSVEPVPEQPVLLRDAKVVEILFTTDGRGWAKTSSTVYHTNDGGISWIDVHAPFESLRSGTSFIDGDTAYIGSPDPSGRIAVTHDSGVTWSTTTIDDVADSYPKFALKTSNVGTVTFVGGNGRSMHVYRTSDGGRTWTGPVTGIVPAGMDGPPQGGDIGGVMWISNGQRDGVPFDDRLVFSIDGGVIWHDRKFPTDTHAPAGELKWVETIRADETGRTVLAVGTADGPSIYVSPDFGRTWRFVKDARGSQVRLLSATDWVLLSEDPMRSESTADGGLTWSTVIGGPRIHLDFVSIASTNDIWAVHDCTRFSGPWYRGPDEWCDGTDAKEVLLVTHDGARTWSAVGP